MTRFEDLDIDTQQEFTKNNIIPLFNIYYHLDEYKNLVIPNWNDIINQYIENFTRENILNNRQGKENYPVGDLQYKEGGASFYYCKLFDNYDVTNKKVAIIGSENPWLEAIVYNYGCKNITTIEYNKPRIDHEIFKVISYDEFIYSNDKFDIIISYSSIEHSGLGRYGDTINPNGDIDTMNTMYNHLTNDGIIALGVPIGKDTLVWNAHRIYGKYRLSLLLQKFNIIEWYGGDETCLDNNPSHDTKFTYQPIIVCKKKSKKITIKIKDGNCNHEPSFFSDTENIHFIRNVTVDSDGDLEINDGDIVIYTNLFQKIIDPKAKKNIALMMEGQEFHREYYDYISNNNDKFDLVLTFDKTLLDRGENFKLNLYGTCWLHDSYINIWPKTKLCSMITSNKTITTGHHLRHAITNYFDTNNNNNIDIYGGKYNILPYMTSSNFTQEHGGRHITNCKINALKEYMFSITIENSKEDYMFTEKLIDCFLTGTIPIYYGCPSIGKFFNSNGIIIIDSLNDLVSLIPTLNIELYITMKPYIEENYKTAQQYKTFIINEQYILDICK